MALRLLVAHTAAERDAAREVEGRVFLQAFGNTPDDMLREYGPYSERSRFVTVIDDAEGAALGAARLILPDDTGMVKTLADVSGDPWRLPVPDSLRAAGLSGHPVWDVASLAVDRRYRAGAAGAEIMLALCYGIYQYSLLSGVPGLVTILDDRVLRLVRAMGGPWTPMPGATSRPYLGSPASTPCVCRVDSIAGSIRTRRPDLAPAAVDGKFQSIALDPADLLPGRGGSQSSVTPRSRLHHSTMGRRDTSGWRPPTHGRSDALLGFPSPST
jgi:hypothetical protein